MNTDPSRAPQFSAAWRALVVAGGTVLLSVSCNTTQGYGPDGNVFVKPRYGYGSPQQGNNTRPAAQNGTNKPGNDRKTPDIKRDPSDTTVDVTPPESKEKKDPATEPATTTETPATTDTTTPPVEKTPETTPEVKPAAPREDLPFGQPVVGKKGYVYSPYAPDKGQVDVDGIPAGTKVKCPYTGKVFRVP